MVNEAEGTFLVMDFSVEGEIPDGGVTFNREGDAARIMEQFDVVQAGIDQETGNIFYRFDEDFVNSDNIEIGHTMKSTISADHRSLDGAVAAKLLKDFSDILEDPFQIWLNSLDMEVI